MDTLCSGGVKIVNCTINIINTQVEYLVRVAALANHEDVGRFIGIYFNACNSHRIGYESEGELYVIKHTKA